MRLAADQANERCRLVEEHEAATREELTTRLEEQASELDRVQHELQTANQLIKERQAAEKSAEASMIMSPTASAVARVQKSGKSFTEVVRAVASEFAASRHC